MPHDMTETPKPIPAEEDISLKDFILKLQDWYKYLRSKWILIGVVCLIGAVLGLVYAWIKKPQYVATLTFALEEKNPNSLLSSYAGLASQLGFNLGGTSGVFSEENIMEMMKSRLMITHTLLDGISTPDGKNESLADYYIEMNHLRKNWKKSPNIPADIHFPVHAHSDSLTYIQDSLMGEFCKDIAQQYLDVEKQNKEASIITVTCTSPDELFSKYFTEGLIKNVSQFYIQTRTKQAATNVDLIQKRLDSVRQAYQAALYGTAISTDQNINPARAVVSVPTISRQTQAQILGAEYAELVKNLEIAKMMLLQETPLIQVIDRPILPLKEKKLGKIKGFVLGGLIAGFIIVSYLIFRKILAEIMEES